MKIQTCIDCGRNCRALIGDEGRCRDCAREQREAEREADAAMRMSILVFGTNDQDVLAGSVDATSERQK